MSGLEDENAAAGSKGDNKKENVRCEVLFCWEELRFPEELHDWCEEVVEDGFGPCESVERAERLKLRQQMAAAAGKKDSVSLPLFMEVNGLEVDED